MHPFLRLGRWAIEQLFRTSSGKSSTSPLSPPRTKSSPPPRTSAKLRAREQDLRHLAAEVNRARQQHGLPPLPLQTQLMHAAQLHAEQMARFGRLEHDLPQAPYPTPRDRAQAAGYDFSLLRENVAEGQRSPAELVQDWMNSPSHRDTILDPTVREMGLGMAAARGGTPYFANLFGKRF